ncbi:AMIN domain-containing protein [Okeania sp.]|uniref:AMIN domain-containing protein n=1 Tax=Okeania sp. TaxID=3100323 RepID=UPI002B4B8CE9|nr:AMIN domain-containing protein [Okeania sp.]MEB3340914.1 AMIN domain-containing protein [Okeania sp.]
MVSQYQKNLSKLKSRLKFISLMGTLAISFSLPSPVFAAFLTNWFFDPDNNQLQFTLPTGTIPTYQVESKPNRLVVYIPNTEVSVNVNELYPEQLVRQVSLSQEKPTQAKVVIHFAPEVAVSYQQIKLEQVKPQENSWQLRLLVNEGEISKPKENNQVLTPPKSEQPSLPEENNQVLTPLKSEQPSLPEADKFIQPPPQPKPVEETNDSDTKSVDVISFGEPLPETSEKNKSEDNADILLKEGKVISLIYPTGKLTLPQDVQIQEVLLLKEAIADQSGRVIVPAKTPVIGSFNTKTQGSKFTARAIYLNGSFISFAAESELLQGNPDIDKQDLAGRSVGGGLALLLLTGSGLGLLAGAALGAGSLVLTAPRQPVTVEANRIVEVRLVKDLPLSRFYDFNNK